MTETVGNLALQICHSNRQAIAALTERLEEKERIVLQLCESNSRAIAALAHKVSENQRTELDLIKANSKIATDAIQSISQLQAVQSSMTQMLSEKQSILQEFRGIINEIVARDERYQTESNRQLEELTREIQALQANFLTLREETIAMLRALLEAERPSHLD